jgi:hypothetical protein
MVMALCLAACGRSPRPGQVAPQTAQDALGKFMDAVKAKDLTRMGELWGTARGPASTYMEGDHLKRQLTTIQIYLDHKGYRVIEGPLPTPPFNPTYKNIPPLDRLRDFRVELQRADCNTVFPMTMVQTNQGGWIVYDVHLEALTTPGRCPPASTTTGTPP